MRIGALPSVTSVETSQIQKLEDLQGSLAGALNVTHGSDNLTGSTRSDFSTLLNRAVTDVEGKMRAAEIEKQKVLTGETNNLHQATIASSEAGVAFSLMIEVRNKLVESYQELMRMQV